jgi:hypothetical protein
MPPAWLIDVADVAVRVPDAYRHRAFRPARIHREGLVFRASGLDQDGIWHYRSRYKWPQKGVPVNAQFVLAPEGTEGERFAVALTNGDPPATVDRAGVTCQLWGMSQGVYQYFVSEDTT